MNERTNSLWLPGLTVLTASVVWMMILQRFNLPVHSPWAHSGLPVLPYLLWIVAQPLFGAVGAYLSRRAGGGRNIRLAASLFPSIVMFALVCGVLVFGIFVERNPHILQQPLNIMVTFLTWVVMPGIGFLIGALILQGGRRASRQSMTPR